MSSQETDLREPLKTGTFAALRSRDFRLFWIGACVSFVGSWVQIVAMGWMVYRMTGSKQALGLIGLAGGLPTTALMLFGGVIADRQNKRALVLGTQSGFALTAFALAILSWTGTIELWHIIGLSFANGVLFAVDGPARQAMVRDLVGDDDLASGVALQSAAFNLARVIGPAIGSLLYGAVGPAWCFFVNAISFLAIIVAILAIRQDLTQRGDAQGSVWHGFLEGLRYLRSNRQMKSVVGLTGITSLFAFSAYTTLMPAIGHDNLHVSEHGYGILFSAVGIGSLVGAGLVGKYAEAARRGALMLLGAFVFSIALFALAYSRSLMTALPLFFLLGASAIAQLATANTLTQSLAPDALRGRAVSVHMFAMAGLQPFGAMLAGIIADRWTLAAALALAAVVQGFYIVLVVAFRRDVARLE